jgi:Spy/CpxP family protein refolding chaperone
MEFNRASRKAIGLLALVFALGIAFGALGSMLMNWNVFASRDHAQQAQAGPPQHHLVARLTTQLNLTADQQKQLTDLLASTQKRYDAIHDQMNPQIAQVRADMRDQIRQLLTPEQRPKFEDFLRQVDEEREKKAEQGTTSSQR